MQAVIAVTAVIQAVTTVTLQSVGASMLPDYKNKLDEKFYFIWLKYVFGELKYVFDSFLCFYKLSFILWVCTWRINIIY